MRAKLSEIAEAFDFVSSAPPSEHEAFLSTEDGQIYWYSEYGADFDELPDDIAEAGKYIEIPHKNDLGLGKSLVLRFAEEALPDDYDKVREIFSRPGAYARFKDLLMHRDKLDDWYNYEAQAQTAALRRWCADQGIEIEG